MDPIQPPSPPALPPTPPRTYALPAPRPKPRSRGWLIVLFLLLLMGGGIWFLSSVFSLSGGQLTRSNGRWYEEQVVGGQKGDGKILSIELGGLITSQSFGGSDPDPVTLVKEQLQLARKDDQVRAVVLQVDSPGGEVLASDEIYHAIRKFQEDSGKPVVASLGSLAASGGYYVSAPCRWIVAHELTLTGSIGVIMQGINFRGLMDKVGVRPETYKSGRYKDMLSGMRTPEEIPAGEREMLQALIDETYTTFKRVVRDGRAAASKAGEAATGDEPRNRKLAADWESYADGRVFSGKDAHRLGFVDELGNLEIAVARAEKLAGITDATLVRYQLPFVFGDMFRLFGKASTTKVTLDIGIDIPKLQAGRMYLLSPTLFH